MTSAEWTVPDHRIGGRARVTSVVDVARFRAATTPEQTGFLLHLQGSSGATAEQLTYGLLDLRARCVAAELLQASHGSGDLDSAGPRAVLLYPPPSADYIAAFLGCMYAGMVPVPAYPPLNVDQWAVLARIIRDCRAELVCTTAEMAHWATDSLTAAGVAGVRVVATDHLTEPLDEADIAHPDCDSTAFLQYTSGSTGHPKGVMVRQRNLLANVEVIETAFGHTAESTGVIWLPPYHDMGLIGGILTPLHQGFPVHLTSPIGFLKDPLSWVRLISETKATTSGGPDFAYALCARKVRPADLEGLDLSSWTVAFNGAEMLRPQTLDAFTESFAPAGFRRSAFLTCYGLAESTLMVTGTDRRREPLVIDEQHVVASGLPHGHEVLIVSPDERRALPDGQEGEIWLRGPSVAAGYWGQVPETEATFAARLADGTGPYLRTGDLGYLHDGQLVVIGRIKDLIIVRGRNIAPAAVEEAAWQAVPLLRPGCSAAFALDGVHGEEVTVVAEARQPDNDPQHLVQAAQAMRAAVSKACGVSLRMVVIVPPGMVPKTSSGKIRRALCRDLLRRAALTELHRTDFAATAEIGNPTGSRTPRPTVTPHGQLADTIAQATAEVLAVPAHAVDRDLPWTELGLDSLATVELAARVQERLGRDVPTGLLFDHPTITRLAAALESHPSACAARPDTTPQPADPADPIAIVGIACRFPGADDSNAFWSLLRAGESAIGAPPPERNELAGCRTGSRPLGALTDIDCFDAPLLGVSAPEARAMDPQHRLLLQTAWAALEESGFDPRSLGGTRTGVYVGISAADYARVAGRGRLSRFTGVGASPAAAAGRVSYHLGLRGPSMAVDTACSSSLTAVHLAVQALRRGECERAVVGGVNLVLDDEPTSALERLGVLSASNRCLPFDAAADGYVRGEGCGVAVLVPLTEARRQGLPVRAVIRGSAQNHNGPGNGITAPSGPAQQEVIRQALQDAALPPSSIGYLEAHGSGTPLGDAIELAAAGHALGRDRPDGDMLRIGSVKAAIGHLEAAAGIAGLITTVLALEHAEFPPLQLPTGRNPKIDWLSHHLTIESEPTPWPRGDTPRTAAVSSFGFSGTNVHVLLEEAPPVPPSEQGQPALRRVIIPVSARTERLLHDAVARLAEALRRSQPDLAAVATTLGEHRTHFTHRAAFHAVSLSELLGKLDKYLTEPPPTAPAVPTAHLELLATNCTGAAPETLSGSAALATLRGWGVRLRVEVEEEFTASGTNAPMARIHFPSLGTERPMPIDVFDIESLFDTACGYYALGGDLDLRAVNGTPAHRVRLPSYPFEKRRYWIDGG